MKLSWPALTRATIIGCLMEVTNAAVQKTCTNYTIPVKPTTSNMNWTTPWKSNYDLIDFVSNFAAGIKGDPYTTTPVQSTGDYNIFATFCSPPSTTYPTSKSGIVLLLNHGLNFDGSYWAPTFQPETYSFADYAISLGYSVFYYDRLGTGLSTKLSGFVNQASIQIAILDELSNAVKAGSYTGSIGKPKSLVLVGHSLGSALVAAAVAAAPTLADGIILTGFTFNNPNAVGFLQGFAPRIASTVNPAKWSNLDYGYFTANDIYADIEVFSKAPDYDVAVAQYTHINRAPVGISELISPGFVNLQPKTFTGVAMVITGERDFIYCNGR
ncbi:hypothetical protein ACMFMF_011841 [Clarireedia jacksonii]